MDLESISELEYNMKFISTLMQLLNIAVDSKDLLNICIKLSEKFMALFKHKEEVEVASLALENLESFRSMKLNIAITRETDAGKSSFINALRRLTAKDVGDAPTGMMETTMEPMDYPHPNNPNVKLWDLPGTGAPDFQPKTYLKQVNFKCYDFFMIITLECFKSSHTTLVLEIERMGKRFYFVRSEVDEDLRNEQRDHPKTFSEHSVLQRLRMDCKEHLQKAGTRNRETFLVSNCDFTKYDDPGLVQSLKNDLPSNVPANYS